MASVKTPTEIEQVCIESILLLLLELSRSQSSIHISPTHTPNEKEQCERACLQHLQPLGEFSPREQAALQEAGVFNEEGEIRLLREQHAAYVSKGLKYLGPGFTCLDARCVRCTCI